MKAINADGSDIICQLVDVCVPVQLSIAGTDSLCPGHWIFINSTLAEASSFNGLKTDFHMQEQVQRPAP